MYGVNTRFGSKKNLFIFVEYKSLFPCSELSSGMY
jgi:hypothetical protein